MNELRKHELLEVEEISEEESEGFKIESISSANWALRKIQAIKANEKEIKALMDEEMKRIKQWANTELKSLENSTKFFEGLLTEYYIKQKELDPKFKISTPYGKVSSRRQQPKWKYDDGKAIESLKSKGISHLIRIKEELDKKELKASVDQLERVFTEYSEINKNIKFLDEENRIFIDESTGEIIDSIDRNIKFYEKAIAYNGQIIEGITVEEVPDSINIKVEV